jgi:hypothetical protein
MSFVVKMFEKAGVSGWISKLNADGLRTVGPLKGAQDFATHEGAQREVERLRDHLPAGSFRFDIELK